MNEKNVIAFENGKKVALFLGGAVYLGVVLLFLAFYENLMTEQFTGLLKTFARVGAFLVSANAIALPVALHYWTVTKWHKIAAIVFYAGDVIIMGLNVMAAAKVGNVPPWLVTYQTYAPATIVYVLAGWAILFMADPGQRALVGLSEAITDAQVSIVKRAAEFVGSDEGTERIIAPFASRLAAKVFNERSLIGTSRGLPPTPDDLDMTAIVGNVLEALSKNGVTGVTPEADDKVTPKESVPERLPFGSNGKNHTS